MKYVAYRKDFFREIKNTYSRFISILCIVTLGVAFYAGIRSSGPDMKASVDRLYDDNQIWDLRIYDTAGLTKEDVEQIQKLSGVEYVEGVFSVDLMDDTKEEKKVIRLISETEQINRFELTSGRWTKQADECVVDEAYLEKMGYELGDKIQIKSGSEIPVEYMVANTELTIVGTYINPMYLKAERGDTTIGNGKIEGLITISPDNVLVESYTEIDVTVQGARELFCYGEKYDNKMEKISDAISKLKDSYIVTDRSTIQSYAEFKMDAERIDKIGNIVPVIFYIVAALVSLTTMTRMVEEQRTLIGTYKAIGYSRYKIAMRYIWYALLATVTGSLFGGLIGNYLLPRVVINAYKMLYPNLYKVVTPIQWEHCLTAILISIICVIGATVASCMRSLRTSAAELMRPAAPKNGKRIFLERIPFLWKHMNFTWKSVARNIIRYKKRIFMTIFGICGCMSLLLTGYGIKDSIRSIVDIQYSKLHKYDMLVKHGAAVKPEEAQALEQIFTDEKIESYLNFYASSVKVSNEKKEISSSVYVTDDFEEFKKYISFGETKQQAKITLSADGVVITKKLAKLLNVKAGDEIILLDAEGKNPHTVRIADIAQNYVSHYVYMSQEMYENLYGTDFCYNQTFIKQSDATEDIREWLLEQDEIASVTTVRSLRENFDYMLTGLDIIIIVIIISAGGLAFVVLYNLNNINICERIRELATLKVLGFYDGEVSAYVFRENVILTIAGILTGYVAGNFLHEFVVSTVEVDMVMFGRDIHSMSYVYATLITVAFALIINLSMHYKLKKVDMTTSLKSIE